MMARAQLCSSTVYQGEGGSGVASAPPEGAATFEQLSARLPLHVVCSQQSIKLCGASSGERGTLTSVCMQTAPFYR